MPISPEFSKSLESGDLDGAIALANDYVRRRPTDCAGRAELAELLCFKGDLDRADKQLEVIAGQDPSVAMGVALFRQLLCAEEARQQFYSDRRLPEFVDAPTPQEQLYLRAAVALQSEDQAGAQQLLQQAEAARVHRSGTVDGKAFDDLRDLDDLSAAHLDVLTSTGKFYWVPIRLVERITLHKPERQRDLIWRRATLELSKGPSGEVFIAALYPRMNGEIGSALQLGRETDYSGGEGTAVRGHGLRCFLVGEESVPLYAVDHIEFAAAG
jgi:type VI secretion system protein ImpE